jgi:bifunctional non-homologous end joining protein LigD
MAVASTSSRRTAPALPKLDQLRPMLAVHGTLPEDDSDVQAEFKWDGMRALTLWDGKRLHIRSRSGLDATHQYPELQELGNVLPRGPLILDGEICVLDDQRRPSFPLLQRRMHVSSPDTARRLARELPVHYILFDVLHTGRQSLITRPLRERRAMLEQLITPGDAWILSTAVIGRARQMLDTARQYGLEGIVIKQLDSPYRPGVRSPEWRKIKLTLGQELVIGGWSPQEGTANVVGALHMGYFDTPRSKKLRYAGAVGSGFSQQTLVQLRTLLEARASSTNPFTDPLPRRDIRFVKPELVAQIDFRRWPDDGYIQQASFKGIRTDKNARTVMKEQAVWR